MRKSSLQKSLLLHTQGVFKWLLLLLGELHGGREFNLNQYDRSDFNFEIDVKTDFLVKFRNHHLKIDLP